MDFIQVDEDKCAQDGICALVCPGGLIEFEKGQFPVPVPEAEEVCIACGHCVAACPTGSLSHRSMRAEDCPPVRKDLFLSPEQCEHFLRSRRSIRAYRKKPVPREEISRLIETARYAPSGHNSQCAEWLVLSDRDELHRLSEVVAEWMRWMIKKIPEIAQLMHMDRVVARWEAGKDVILRDAPTVIVAHAEQDNRMAPATCTIALAYLELAATSMGLGCCWAGYFMAAATGFPPMIEALPLPQGHQCFGAMMVGYPKVAYHRLPMRNAPSITWRE